ncbi:MAG: GTPase HflX [Geobacter sp.]|nr:GTPase HflX [Geobacter sp.]
MGLKPSQVNALERLYRRRVPEGELVNLELARLLQELSREVRRQIGILVNRFGELAYVIVGTDRGIMIPELADYPLGRRMLRGLRLIHTHLKYEPLTDDDLTDLAMLRLDLVAVLLESEPPQVQLAWLTPAATGAHPYHVEPPQPLARFQFDFPAFIASREAELTKAAPAAAEVGKGGERGILISVSQAGHEEAADSLEELQELSRTAGVQVLDTVVQRPRSLNPRTLMGEGKLRDVLAQLKYLLPRLTGRGVQMSRLMGGIGGRGPGETKLEIDRRRIRDRIAKLERVLEELSAGRYQRRQKRVRAGVPIVSIVGYTNAGKSTLLNALTRSEVFTENLLFATLDTSTRRLRFPREREVIITDTVGFIRSLPASHMGAFKATLEALQDADLLLHVVDCSSPRCAEQVEQVDRILEELGLADKPRLVVFNKNDLLAGLKRKNPLAFMKVRQLTRRLGAITLSACDATTLEPLLIELERRFWPGKGSP